MPQRVDCGGRERLQPAKGHGNCPRLNGFFHHPEFCDQYFYCANGIASLITCPVGLIYDPKVGFIPRPWPEFTDYTAFLHERIGFHEVEQNLGI